MGLAAMMPHIYVTPIISSLLEHSFGLLIKKSKTLVEPQGELFDLVTFFLSQKASALFPLGDFRIN